MISETPGFWWEKPGLLSFSLKPFSCIYGMVARQRLRRVSIPQIDLPVLCIGNFTLGGSGKTPVTLAFAKAATALGIKAGIVSRGHGGKAGRGRHAHRVDALHDRAHDVGDEPLLLASHAPVVIGVDRLAAARQLKHMGCELILMDDGFQSRRLRPDFSLLIVDALRGIGNSCVFPAGPLRAPIKAQLALTDALLVVGKGENADAVVRLAARHAKPVSVAGFTSSASHKIGKKKFLAFAGIGNPQRFFQMIEAMGGRIVHQRVFADHHFFTAHELQALAAAAASQNLWLATTAKDQVRITTSGQMKYLKKLVVFDIEPNFTEPDYLIRILRQTQERFRKRILQG